MHCQKVVDLFVEYIDGEMEPEQLDRLEEHLSHCPGCVDFLDSYRRTGSVCKEALKKEMPPAMKSSLSQFLRDELQSPKSEQ